MSKNVTGAILEQVQGLAPKEQQLVLEFARALAVSRPRGVAGKDLLRFAGIIPKEDLKAMSAAIEEGCEQVNANEW
jgi:hypothetical protein